MLIDPIVGVSLIPINVLYVPLMISASVCIFETGEQKKGLREHGVRSGGEVEPACGFSLFLCKWLMK